MTWSRLIEELAALERAVADLAIVAGIGKRPWTEAERQVVRDYYPDTPAWMIARALQRTDTAVYRMASKLGVTKAEDWIDNPLSNTTRIDPGRGRASQFKPGHATWNAGMKGWKAGGRSAETRYKPGNISGRAAL